MSTRGARLPGVWPLIATGVAWLGTAAAAPTSAPGPETASAEPGRFTGNVPAAMRPVSAVLFVLVVAAGIAFKVRQARNDVDHAKRALLLRDPPLLRAMQVADDAQARKLLKDPQLKEMAAQRTPQSSRSTSSYLGYGMGEGDIALQAIGHPVLVTIELIQAACQALEAHGRDSEEAGRALAELENTPLWRQTQAAAEHLARMVDEHGEDSPEARSAEEGFRAAPLSHLPAMQALQQLMQEATDLGDPDPHAKGKNKGV